MANAMIPNSSQLPNIYVDRIMHMLTPEEWKVLSFAVRHIFGFDEGRATQMKNISLSMFEKGGGTETWRYEGVGLNKGTIRKCLKALADFGILVDVSKSQKGTLYKLTISEELIAWDKLATRQQAQTEKAAKRTSKARATNANNSGVLSDNTPTVTQHTGILSDNTEGVLSDSNNKTQETKGNQNAPAPNGSGKGLAARAYKFAVILGRYRLEGLEPKPEQVNILIGKNSKGVAGQLARDKDLAHLTDEDLQKFLSDWTSENPDAKRMGALDTIRRNWIEWAALQTPADPRASQKWQANAQLYDAFAAAFSDRWSDVDILAQDFSGIEAWWFHTGQYEYGDKSDG